MKTGLPVAARTLVIMLGASDFPNDPSKSRESFRNSAKALRDYFQDPQGFGLPKGNLLWLFNSDLSSIDQDTRIEEFLGAAMERSEEERPLDVIVYYVGHGFFGGETIFGDQRLYYLATRNFKPDKDERSFRFKSLQQTVKERVRHVRKFYILDACFSAAAVKELMSTATAQQIIMEAEREAVDELPAYGSAVLCAAGPEDPAKAPLSQTYTMFTGALLEVLGNYSEVTETLSLYEVYRLVTHAIKCKFGNDGVRPHYYVRVPTQGNVGELPLFPIRRREVDYTTKEEKRKLEEQRQRKLEEHRSAEAARQAKELRKRETPLSQREKKRSVKQAPLKASKRQLRFRPVVVGFLLTAIGIWAAVDRQGIKGWLGIGGKPNQNGKELTEKTRLPNTAPTVSPSATVPRPTPDEHLFTVAGELEVYGVGYGKQYSNAFISLNGRKIIEIDHNNESSRFSGYPLISIIKHIARRITPFDEVVVFQQNSMGNACSGGPIWFLGLKRNGSFTISDPIDFCGGKYEIPIIEEGDNMITVIIPGGPPNRGEGHIPGETRVYQNGKIRKVRTRKEYM